MAFTLIDGVVANDAFATPATPGTSSLVDGINNQAFATPASATAQPVDGVLGLTTWTFSGGGPTTYNDTLSESVVAGHSFINSATFPNSMSESMTPAAGEASLQTFVLLLTEAQPLADQYASTVSGGAATYNETIAEALAMADQYIAASVYPNAISESVAAGETIGSAALFASILTESIGATDGFSPAFTLTTSIAEAIALLDALGSTAVMVASIGATVAVLDSSTAPGATTEADILALRRRRRR
jgi:hypothetical protein